jgi:protein-tyrosine phosphatase
MNTDKNIVVKILFVCMGNICRSPAAEGIMKKLVEQNNLQDKIEIDSAGTIDYHTGELPDSRMIKYAFGRGYELNHRARQFNPKTDFEKFDYILTMDDEIFQEITSLDIKKKYQNKIYKMVSFLKNIKAEEVPDPYYSGRDGFEKVLDILEDSVGGLFERVQNDIK